MRKLAKNFPLLTFLSLTFLIAWAPGIPHYMGGNGRILEIAFWVSGSAPGIALLILSRILSPKVYDSQQNKRALVFLVSWALSSVVVYYIFIVLEAYSFSGLGQFLSIITCMLMGLIPALFLSSVFSKNPHVRRYFTSLLHPKGHVGYYLFAFFLPMIILIFSIPFNTDLGIGPDVIKDSCEPIKIFISVIIILIFYFFLDGGFNEEVGWSGFALPMLQERYSPLKSSVLLGLIWAVWHIPKWTLVISAGGLFHPLWILLLIALQLIRLVFFRIILTWLFNKTNGGIIPPMILHASHNLLSSSPIVELSVYGICSVFMVINSRMWRNIPVENNTRFSPDL